MLYIAGHKIDENKKLIYGLRQIYGIGLSNALQLSKDLGFAPNLKIKNLSEEQKAEILSYIRQNFLIEASLKKKVLTNIEKYINNGSLKGFRHKNNLPVRGQRTHTNGRTPKKLNLLHILKQAKD
jgi:small subunit ribosomal protein S13